MESTAETPAAPPAPGRYAAPALEKGLDILEALAAEPAGLSQQAVAAALGRSVGEIFRMLEVLVARGFVGRDGTTGRYALTLKLFDLAHRHPPTRRLLEAALPAMRGLADAAGQSVHLAVRAADRLLVLAQAEGFSDMGFSVKPGSSYPFAAERSSARVLAAFDPGAEAMLGDGALPDLARIRRQGFLLAPAGMVAGVTDICAAVRDASGAAVATLNLTFLARRDAPATPAALAPLVCQAAGAVSAALGFQAPRGPLEADAAVRPAPR